jgi:hypothetical protein
LKRKPSTRAWRSEGFGGGGKKVAAAADLLSCDFFWLWVVLGFYGGGSLRCSGGRLWLGFGLILVYVCAAAAADLGAAAAAEYSGGGGVVLAARSQKRGALMP